MSAMLWTTGAQAQIAGYGFTQVAGSYSPVSGGTQLIAAAVDDGSSAATNIGFTFNLAGTNYTQFVANSNGNIRLGATAPSAPTTPISTTSNTGAISGFGRDGRTGGAVVYQLTGTAPNQVLTIDYPDFNPYWNNSSYKQSFQIKLFETTNVIQIIYGPNASPTTYTCQVGIRATPADFANRTTTTNWAASTAGSVSSTMTWSSTVYPANGLTYTWTPPSCAAPSALVATPTTTTTANISWTAPLTPPSNGYEYAVTTSAVPPPSGTAFAGTSTSVTGLTANTTYFLHVRSYCGGIDYSAWMTFSFFTGYCTPAPSSVDGQGITNVNMGTINNTTVNEAGNYGDYSAQTTNVYETQLVSCAITYKTGYTYGTQIWVDWNNNLSFLDAGELVYTGISTSNNPTTLTASFTVPSGQPLGNYRIRIGGTDNDPGPGNPCYTGSYGCFEDYTLTVIAPPSCLPPTALIGTPTTATTANISWTAANPVPSNGYEYAVTTSATPPVSGTAFAGTSTGVTGLTANTTYYLHVRSDCGGGNFSSWATSTAFTTPCAAISSLPWTEGFESATLPNLPSACWLEDPSSGDWVTTNNSSSTYDADARTGSQFLRDAYSATNEFVWTPGFALTSGQSYDFSFWWAGDNYSGWTGDIFYNTVQSGTGATQMGGSFVTSGTTTTKTYVQETRTFIAPTTGTYYFAVRVNATGGPWYLSFDDFRFEQTPSCAAPTALVGTPTTATTANISWTAPLTPPSNGYEYAVTTSATPPVSGTAFAGTSTGVTGLTAQTTYYLHVRSDCGGGNFSPWASSTAFTTPCLAINTFPYTESFSATIPNCWAASEDYPGASYHWAPTTADASNGAAAPQAGTHFMYLYVFLASSSYNSYNLTTIPFDLGATPKFMSYYYFLGGSGYTSTPVPMTVKISTDGGSTWTNLYQHNNNNSTFGAWTQNTIDLTAYANQSVLIRFASNSNYGSGICDQGLDEFSIYDAPSCLPPTALIGSPTTATTANISWTAPNPVPSNGYEYAVSTSATPPVSGTAFAGTSTNVTGLTANTTYYLHVRSDCGGGNFSSWATSSFYTGYCQVSVTYTGDNISNFSTTGATTNITNPSTGTAAYEDFTAQTLSSYSGQSINFSGSYVGGSAGFSIWVDWNNNLVFDPSELMYNASSTASSWTGSFIVPVVADGNYRMRIRAQWNTLSPPACGNTTYGQAEDYTFNVYTPVACSGTPAAGTASGPASVCSTIGFTVSTAGSTINETGISGQWYSSTDGGTTWNPISGATAISYNVAGGITVPTMYHYVITCSNSGLSATSNDVSVAINLPSACYCTPSTTGGSSYYISNFTTTGGTTNINQSGGGIASGYTDYSGSVLGEFEPGATINFSMSVYGGTFGHAIWIDFDADGIFQSSEQIVTSSSYLSSPITGSFTIPGNASTGVRRMRILASYTPNNPSNACTNSGSGEYEDYSVNITPPVCISAPTAPLNAGSACADVITNTVLLSWPSLTGATGYDVYFDTVNPPTALVSTNQAGLSYSADVSGGAPVYYWMVVPQILGGGSSCNVWSFSLSPSPVPIASSGGDVCQGNDIFLSGDNAAPGQLSGNTYVWTGPNSFTSTLQYPSISSPGSSYSGTYTVVVTNQYGCTASESTSLNVNENPTLGIDSIKNVGCIGGSDGIIYVTASGGLSPYSFTSDFVTFNSTGVMTNLPIGLSTIYVADGNGCQAQVSGSLTYTSTAPPAQSVIVPMTGMPAYACNGTSVTVSIPAVANATQYTWDGPAGTTFNGNPSPYISTTPVVTVVFGNPNGSGYRIGVQAGNGCGSSLRKSQWVRGIVSTPAVVSGATTTCASTSGTYSIAAVDGATSYLWTISGDATVNGNGTSVTVNFGPSWTGGTLCVSAQTPCFNSPSKCLVIGTSASPLNTISGPLSACPNDVLTFSVPASSGAASYAWTVPANSSITGGLGTNSIQVTFAPGYNNLGNICVNVTSICGVTSANKCRTVAPGVPSVPASITGATNGLCGQSISYSTPFKPGTTYNWTAPGTITGNGSNAVSIAYGSFTSGQVCVTASTGCGTSAARCIAIKGQPNSPVSLSAIPASWCANTQGVEFTANVSNTAGSYTLSWTYPSAPVATYTAGGGNTTSLTLDWGTGNGTVIVSATNSCGTGSKAFVATVGCKEGEMASANKLNVYPNPTAGVLNIEYTAEKGNAQVTVLDLSGRVVMTQTHANVSGQNNLQLDLSKVAKGAYMLNVQTEGSNNQVRVVVE
ncbi:MAG TPA: GEVED domain-containing protein [Bacteroidia bacterium]|nr:GEVED domain-containing protein [Bacteroidia bacterium]